MILQGLLVTSLVFAQLSVAGPLQLQKVQQPLLKTQNVAAPRKLHGQFLHITDIHPDPFFILHSSISKEHPCHDGKGRAGVYGAENSECDSPFSLATATFKWIKENIRDEIDFVVWTGDSARHDNDIEHPRTEKQVFDLNRLVVNLVKDTFGKDGPDDDDDPTNDLIIPVIPSVGNNDILPHNIMLPGPSSTTKQYLNIWQNFIPEEQTHVFERGAYFFVEVIPHKLAVFSLNTLYFFSSNTATDGCDDRDEPGYAQFEWLKIQLQIIRERKMKAILIGHVPPALTKSKESWDTSCWKKYAIWTESYRDVLIAGLYGHMNIDHFELLDSRLVDVKFHSQAEDDDTSVSIQQSDERFLSGLRQMFADIPNTPKEGAKSAGDSAKQSVEKTVTLAGGKKGKSGKGKKGKKGKSKKDKYIKKIGGPYGERYIPIFVSPSVVPNYFPTIRIMEYNISGLVNAEGYPLSQIEATQAPNYTPQASEETSAKKGKKDKKGKKGPKKPKTPRPDYPSPPPTGSAPGPAYSLQPFSLIGYSQFYANLTEINGWVPREHDDDDDDHRKRKKKKEQSANADNEDKQKPKPSPQNLIFELEYDTRNDTHGYNLTDLTMLNLLKLAKKISKGAPEADKKDLYDMEDDYVFLAKIEDGGVSELVKRIPEPRLEMGTRLSTSKQGEKKDKKKKKNGRKHKSKHENKMWHSFLKRAFVGSVGDEDLDQMD